MASADSDVTRAIEQKAWSQIAGLYGIRAALAQAARQLSAEGHSSLAPSLAAIAQRFESYSAESAQARDDALADGRYSDVAGHDGVSTGWLLAHRIVLAELASNKA